MLIRKLETALAALVLTGAAAAGSASAQDNTMSGIRAESPEVVERGPDGRATRVRIGDTVYTVCTSEGQDGCIQPRAAGLGWGNRPLQHWPGQPASQRRASVETRDQDSRRPDARRQY